MPSGGVSRRHYVASLLASPVDELFALLAANKASYDLPASRILCQASGVTA